MDIQEIIRSHGALAICRAVSRLIFGDYSEIRLIGLADCECLDDVLEIMRAAYGTLSTLERTFYAQTLSELEELAVIEQALVLKGQLSRSG